AGSLPDEWGETLAPALTALWQALPLLGSWNARQGWCGKPVGTNPYPSACLLALLLLGRLSPAAWARPGDVADCLLTHHPFWRESLPKARSVKDRGWVETFLLGLAYQLRLLQAARGSEGDWLVRLSPWGRGLLGLAPLPAEV